jgi:triacylglycerol lipase
MPLEPQAKTYSVSNARLLGQAAAVAYEPPETCDRWARAHGFGDFEFFCSDSSAPKTDTQGFVAQNGEMIIVAFRGTQPNQRIDWLSDFEALHETWAHPTGKVHKGFYEALRAVWGHPVNGREILPGRLLDRGDRTVWITGHSLGGALAEVCAAQAYFACHIPVQGVYTFGQPRVGDDAFARLVHAALGDRIFRFINNHDIVPRVPFFGMGFRHYGTELFFDANQKQVDVPSSVENLAAALRLAKLALTVDAVAQAAKMIAAATIKAGLHGDPGKTLQEMVKAQEDAALGAAKLLLQAGTAQIENHNMRAHYLPCLGTTLDLDAAVA